MRELLAAEHVDEGVRLEVVLEPVSQLELEVLVPVQFDQGTVVVDLVEQGRLVVVLLPLGRGPLILPLLFVLLASGRPLVVLRLEGRLRSHSAPPDLGESGAHWLVALVGLE